MATAQKYPVATGAFGTNISPIPMPNPSGDLAALYPNLSATNAAMSGNVLSELRGQLSPDTISNIVNSSAAWGVGSGMPGSQLAKNLIPRSIGLTTNQLQRQGLQDYSSVIPVISGTQTVRPETQAEINATNAFNAAAPNPTAAANYAMELYDQYMNPAGSTGWLLKNNPSLAQSLQQGGGSAFLKAGQSTWQPGSALQGV